MNANYQSQLNTLVDLLNTVSACIIKELKNADKHQYTTETELNYLEFIVRKHLQKKHIPVIQQEQVLVLLREHLNKS